MNWLKILETQIQTLQDLLKNEEFRKDKMMQRYVADQIGELLENLIIIGYKKE